MKLDPRKKQLLTTLIKNYIQEGQPIGSKVLCERLNTTISSATVRNIMADLERLGLLSSPHTSSGRVPTPKAYKYFVETLMTNAEANEHENTGCEEYAQRFETDQITPKKTERQSTKKIIENVANLLSSMTKFTGIVQAPQEVFLFSRIEFLKLAPRRILLIIVSSNGEVQNKLLQTEIDYTPKQLKDASYYMNHCYAGIDFTKIGQMLKGEIDVISSDMVQLITQTAKVGNEVLSQNKKDMIISGENNLLNINDYTANINALRQLFALFEEKTQLMQLLDQSSKTECMQIFIGGDSEFVPNIDMSVITAPYSKNGKIVGTLGVIGPTRMEYQKVISVVDIASRMLTQELNANETIYND